MNQSKKVLITGSNGQDGSYMVDFLLENTENTIIAATRRTSQPILNHLEKYFDNPRVKFITLDLGDGHSIERVILSEKPDYFINFGAYAFVPDSWAMPTAVMNVNSVSIIHILEAIRKHVPYCRFYNASSSEIFGNVKEIPQTEETLPNPRSIYGVSKNTAREITKVYRESYDLYAVNGILFNHESERRQAHYVTRKITKNVARILNENRDGMTIKPLELGNVEAKRDWSYAPDFVKGIWMMLNQQETAIQKSVKEGKAGHYDFDFIPKDYVLSSNETHSVKEFVENAFVAAGFGIETLEWRGEGDRTELWCGDKLFVKVNPEFYRPAEVDLLLGDSTSIREDLGWEPESSFFDLVHKMAWADINSV